MYSNIPAEFQALIQWVCWRYETLEGSERPTKVPYNPKSGRHASVTDGNTWSSFEEVTAATGYDGIGLVLTARDPYTAIDLDHSDNPEIIARQNAIYSAFDSYAERSPSGTGCHIWIKASIPHGRKRDCVEIYSSARYMTFTGDVVRNVPIADYNDLANQLWEQMAPASETNDNGFYGDPTQHDEDSVIYDRAAKAANGDKFVALYNGDWQQFYSSQSEADYALIDIISFYTQNQPQIMRMFRTSALGQREKAGRDKYVFDMIKKSFDNQLPPVDFSGLIDEMNAAIASAAVAKGGEVLPATVETPRPINNADTPLGIDLNYWRNEPPGLLSMIRQYVYAASPRPLYETSLTAAIGLMAGITGRQFNISNTGLNQYIIFVADTGRGKDAISAGISRIMSSVTVGIEHKSAAEYIGPSEIASGQALLKALPSRSTPCFVSLIGEVGLKLQQITHPQANGADKTLHRVLLDIYGKSGAGQVVYPTIYADKAKDTEAVHSPAVTLLGEGTGHTFYQALEVENVQTGLVPRFLVIEYDGPRPAMNYDHHNHTIPVQLKTAISDLVLYCQKLAMGSEAQPGKGSVITVGMAPDADSFQKAFNTYCDNEMDNGSNEAIKQIWNRTHLKALRLGGLLAVAHNYLNPVMTVEMFHWAASLVLTDTLRMLAKFEAGEIGVVNDEVTQDDDFYRILAEYISRPFHEVAKYGVRENLKNDGLIQHNFLSRRLMNVSSFRRDRMGPTFAIKRMINSAIDSGMISPVPTNQMISNYKYHGKTYAIANANAILNR